MTACPSRVGLLPISMEAACVVADVAKMAKKGFMVRIYSFLSMAAHLLAISFVGYIIYLAWPFSSLFAWHPVLMSLAFMFLMTEAILVFSPESSLLGGANRKTMVNYHWITNSTAVMCALAGLTIIMVNKERDGKYHFTSWHGLIGVCTVAYSCVQAAAGSMVRYPNLTAGFIKLSSLKLYHATSGLVLFSLACTTLVLGLMTGWFTSLSHHIGWYLCMGVIGWLGFVVIMQVARAYLPKALKKPSQQY